MTATTTTTIQGVSVLSRQKKRGTDVFELGLSHAGIEVRRPGRPVQQMTWDRVSEWEIEERKGHVLLTLRGRGATTPLVVPGWSLDDLELLMRTVTTDAISYEPAGPGPVVGRPDTNGAAPAAADGNGAGPSAPAAAMVAPAPPKTRPKRARPAADTVTAVAVAAATQAAPVAPPVPTPAVAAKKPRPPSRAERRQQSSRPRRTREVTWKAVVTVALLGVVAVAVTVVLLQSAGVISWGFLGPVA